MENSQFHMIDISEKVETARIAIARGSFFADSKTIQRIREKTLPKGDVLTLSEVAGIQGAKMCSQWLPLCHPLILNSIRVSHEVFIDEVRVRCEVKTSGKTGVEMEALCGVQAALLCIYDLTKNIDPVLRIGDVFLERKEGGKSGLFESPFLPGSSSNDLLKDLNVGLITLSDRCSQGETIDQSTLEMKAWFSKRNAKIVTCHLIPDDPNALIRTLDENLTLLSTQGKGVVVLSGGTGIGPRDVTPETLDDFAKKRSGSKIPGIGEKLRQDGAKYTHFSWLSRSCAYLIQGSVVIALPGSPKAVVQGLDSLTELLSHFGPMLNGEKHS